MRLHFYSSHFLKCFNCHVTICHICMHMKGFQTPIQSENCHMNFNVTKSLTDTVFKRLRFVTFAYETLQTLSQRDLMIPIQGISHMSAWPYKEVVIFLGACVFLFYGFMVGIVFLSKCEHAMLHHFSHLM